MQTKGHYKKAQARDAVFFPRAVESLFSTLFELCERGLKARVARRSMQRNTLEMQCQKVG